jgi:hypothetical protein
MRFIRGRTGPKALYILFFYFCLISNVDAGELGSGH